MTSQIQSGTELPVQVHTDQAHLIATLARGER